MDLLTRESSGFVFARTTVANLRLTGLTTPVNWNTCQFYDKENHKWHSSAMEATVFDLSFDGQIVTGLRPVVNPTMVYLFIRVNVTSSEKKVWSRDSITQKGRF